MSISGIFALNDGLSIAAAIFSRDDGSLIETNTSVSICERATILPNGTFMVRASSPNPGTGPLYIYTPDLSQVASITTPANTSNLEPLGASADHFYATAKVFGTGLVLYQYLPDGTLTNTWTINASGSIQASGMCVNADNTICYFGHLESGLTHIKRFDLVNNVAMTDLVVLGANEQTSGYGFVCLPTQGDILFKVTKPFTTFGEIRRYSPAGTLNFTYTLDADPEGGGEEILLAVDYVDPMTFWYRIDPDPTGATCIFRQILISDGTQLKSFTKGMNSVPPNDLGNAPASCPMLIFAAAPPPPPVTIPGCVATLPGGTGGGLGCVPSLPIQ